MRNEATCKATLPTCAGLAATLLATKHRHFLASHVEATSLITACSRLIAWQLTRPLHINHLDVCVAPPVVERSSINDAKEAARRSVTFRKTSTSQQHCTAPSSALASRASRNKHMHQHSTPKSPWQRSTLQARIACSSKHYD